MTEVPTVGEVERLQALEFGTEEVSLDIKEDFSDAMTLRENASKLEDGLYTAGNNYVYSVVNGKATVLPEYRSRYDWATSKFVFTIRPLTPSIISEVPIFHGTQAKGVTLKNIDISRSGQNFAGVGGNEFTGIYFSTIPSEAKGYGALGTVEGNLVEARISPDAKVIRYRDTGDKSTDELLSEGIDVILKYEQGGEIGEVIVLNPKVLVAPTPPTLEVFKTPVGRELIQGGNPSFTAKEAKSIGGQLGIDFKSYDVDQFRQGLDVELEHCNVTNCDPLLTGKIAQAHLNELPDYYTRLAKMEEKSIMKTETERKSFHERIFGKGSTPPLERLGKGETMNNLLPMPPEEGPPLPRMLALKWPWKK